MAHTLTHTDSAHPLEPVATPARVVSAATAAIPAPAPGPRSGPALEIAPDRVSSSDDYSRRFSGPAGRYLLDVQTRGLLSLVKPLGQGLRILDIGGGHAQSARPLAQAGHHVTILNSREEYEIRARRECAGHDIDFLSGPLDAPPVDPGSYDLVVALRMVMHMPDWHGFVASMCEKAGRAVLIDYPSWRSCNILEPMLFDVKRRLEGGSTREFRLFWPSQIREAFLGCGFDVTRSYAQCVLPLVVHRAVQKPAITGAAEAVARATGLTKLFGSPLLSLAVRR